MTKLWPLVNSGPKNKSATSHNASVTSPHATRSLRKNFIHLANSDQQTMQPGDHHAQTGICRRTQQMPRREAPADSFLLLSNRRGLRTTVLSMAAAQLSQLVNALHMKNSSRNQKKNELKLRHMRKQNNHHVCCGSSSSITHPLEALARPPATETAQHHTRHVDFDSPRFLLSTRKCLDSNHFSKLERSFSDNTIFT